MSSSVHDINKIYTVEEIKTDQDAVNSSPKQKMAATQRTIVEKPTNEQTEQLSQNEVEFAVFCVENVAENLGITGQEVYQKLSFESDILDEYIIPNYEILHTQGRGYIVEDIIEYMKERGVIE